MRRALVAGFLIVVSHALAVASPAPVKLSHGGFLIGASDQPLDATGISLAFSIWDDAATGARVWPASAAVTCPTDVKAGYYGVVLGDGCGSGLTTAELPAGEDRWLEVAVGGVTLAPRIYLAAAARAADADRLAGYSLAELDARYALPGSGVVPGTYGRANVTVDAQGRVTSATSGDATTLAGYGITDGVANAGATPSIASGLASSRPTAGNAGRLWVSTDTGQWSRDTGSGWEVLGRNAADLTTGTVAPARLGSGTASSSTYLRGDGTWAPVAGGSGGLVTLTDAASIAIDLTAGTSFAVTLGGNRAMANPPSIPVGTFSIFVTQDATGGRTLSWGSHWRFGGTPPVISSWPGATDLLVFASNGSALGLVSHTRDLFSSGVNYWGSGADGAFAPVSSTNLCDSTADGEMCVKHYSSLDIPSGVTVTTAVRRRGLLVYVAGDAVINGTLTMTARGANADPVALGVPAGGLVFARRTAVGAASGSSVLTGAGSAAVAAEANQLAILGNGTLFTHARGGASGGSGLCTTCTAPGNAGTTGGLGQTGGGGGGGNGGGSGYSGSGAAGTVFSGGAGGGGCSDNNPSGGAGNGASNGGAGGNGNNNAVSTTTGGGGAGNPGGAAGVPGSGATAGSPGSSGTGGLLILLVKGNLTGTGTISANGTAGGAGKGGGGGSGGGNVLVLHGGTYGGGLTIQALGGAGGAAVSSTSPGGAGGNGNVQGPTQILK